MKTQSYKLNALLIITGIALLCLPEVSSAAGKWSAFWDREFYGEVAGFNVIDNVPEREDQYYGYLTLVYEKPALFKHYSTGFFIMPVWYHDPTGNIHGITVGIMDRFWLDPQCRKGLFAKFHIGALFTDVKFIENDSRFNFFASGGLGYQWEEPDMFVHLGFQHISNNDSRSPNLGINALGLTFGLQL